MVRPLLASAATLVVLGSAAPSDAVASDLQRSLLRAINRTRVAHHRRHLSPQAGLARAAGRHSRAMARSGQLAHAPDWAAPLRRVTPHARMWAENLARIPAGAPAAVARQTVLAWLHSPPHRRNLLSPRLDAVGLGSQNGGAGVFITADFADL
jgi:uncharacterized protein YkwD